MRPRGIFHFTWDVLIRKIDMEVVFVGNLTIAELCEIIRLGIWPEAQIGICPEALSTADSEAYRRQGEAAAI